MSRGGPVDGTDRPVRVQACAVEDRFGHPESSSAEVPLGCHERLYLCWLGFDDPERSVGAVDAGSAFGIV
jgi:hypothetical protein